MFLRLKVPVYGFMLKLIPRAIFPGQDSSCLKATFAESDRIISSFLFRLLELMFVRKIGTFG